MSGQTIDGFQTLSYKGNTPPLGPVPCPGVSFGRREVPERIPPGRREVSGTAG